VTGVGEREKGRKGEREKGRRGDAEIGRWRRLGDGEIGDGGAWEMAEAMI
jgi:hypothetical protein